MPTTASLLRPPAGLLAAASMRERIGQASHERQGEFAPDAGFGEDAGLRLLLVLSSFVGAAGLVPRMPKTFSEESIQR